MTISDKPEAVYEVARRCPIAALVLADPKGDRFHVMFLGQGTKQTEEETTASLAAGLSQQAGVLGITREGELQSVAKMGFSDTILRASDVFLYALVDRNRRRRKEIAELERIARLTGRGQA